MRKDIAAISFALMLVSCSSQQGPRRPGPAPFAQNPSVILALDIAQNLLAAETDAYAALRETAAENALIFVPEPVPAKSWLKAQPPLKNTSWQPHRVFMSCDGKTGVTTGAIKWGEVHGYYTTVWQFFQKRDGTGEWRWLLSHGDGVETPRAVPEFLQTKTASCDGAPNIPLAAPEAGEQMMTGLSRDQSLRWTWRYRADKSRTLAVETWNGKAWEPAFTDKVVATAAAPSP